MYNQFGPQFMPMAQNQPFQPWGQNLQRQEIIRVNGENGARAFQMAPNSSAILMDESNPVVWMVQTDGAGYKTATPFAITPYQAQPEPDYGDLDRRLKRLEDMLNGEKPNAGPAKRGKQSADAAE